MNTNESWTRHDLAAVGEAASSSNLLPCAAGRAASVRGNARTRVALREEKEEVEKRTLSDSLEVSAIGLGCLTMNTNLFGTPSGSREEMIALIRRAVERGVTLFDTAQVCGAFVNEELVGEAVEPVRDRDAIATKFGFDLYGAGRESGLDSRPETIKIGVDQSLKRLRSDYIDLLYQHRVDPEVLDDGDR
jgi:aryl-alcohol dehydrogenase-like predicted oxidoreductase